MRHGDVVALQIVVDDHLPVGVLLLAVRHVMDTVLADRDQAGSGVVADGLGQPGAALGERGRLHVQVDEDEAEEGLDVDRVQSEPGLVQAGDPAGLGALTSRPSSL